MDSLEHVHSNRDLWPMACSQPQGSQQALLTIVLPKLSVDKNNAMKCRRLGTSKAACT